MSRLISALGRTSIRNSSAREEGVGEGILSIAASDAGWRATLSDDGGERWQGHATTFAEHGAASTANNLQQAIARLAAEGPKIRVTRVAVVTDDVETNLVDHRFAKLTNFEPRALKEFGAQQTGGKPVVFGSLSFGASSAREIERRVLAFLPEERLGTYFSALGNLAKGLVSVTPALVPILLRQAQEGGVFATLRVHGYFSTLLIANAETGLIAMRQLPFGSLMIAKAYAAAHAMPLKAAQAWAAALGNDSSPEDASLAPLLRQLQDDITATIDYFRFQRMAGRPAYMSLAFTGSPLGRLDTFLADALDLQVQAEPEIDARLSDSELTALNFLQGSRPGLLRIGNQPYEFSSGQFVPMKESHSEMPVTKGSGKEASVGWLNGAVVRASAAPSAPMRERLMLAAAVVGLGTFLILGNLNLLISPVVNRMDDQASAYRAAAEQSAGVPKSGTEAAAQTREPAVLWAENLLSVSEALLSPMRVTRLELAAPGGQAGAGASLAISGALPSQNPDNLKLVAEFIDRLSMDPGFQRRFGEVRFTGATASTEKERPEMVFHVAGVAKGAPP